MWKQLILLYYFHQYVQTDTLFFLNNGSAQCILPSQKAQSNLLFVYPFSEIGDCCKKASFMSIGTGIYMEASSKLCIDIPNTLSSWDGIQTKLGGACSGSFYMTEGFKMKVYSQDYCLSYNSNSEVIFKKCKDAFSPMAFEKCNVDPFAKTTNAPTLKETTVKEIITTTTTTATTTTSASTTTTVAPWSEWSECSVLCGFGVKTRTQIITENCLENCHLNETAACHPDCIGTQLSKDGDSCDKYCTNIGFLCNPVMENENWFQLLQTLNITCSNSNLKEKLWGEEWHPSYKAESRSCIGYINTPSFINCSAVAPAGEKRICECDEIYDIGFRGWASWSDCSKSCESGVKNRTRYCLSKDGCSGKSYQTELCNTFPCPIDGGYAEWGSWTKNCTKVCGMGVLTRSRTCTNPKPLYGGLPCYGSAEDFIFCNVQMCPIDGGWTEWTAFDDCNKPCNTGYRVRYRFCVEPRPDYGGKECEGDATEQIECNLYACNDIIVLVNLTVQNQPYSEDLKDPTSKRFGDLQTLLFQSLQELYSSTPYKDSILSVVLFPNVRKGSENNTLDMSIEVNYNAIDEFQLLMLQDAINLMKSISKISVSPKYNATANHVPNQYPLNLVAYSLSYSTINVTWDAMHFEGGFLNYLIFYKIKSESKYNVKPATSTWKELIGLQPDTWYTIRIAIDTKNGNGLTSPTIEAKTLATKPLIAPQFLVNQVTGAFSIFVSWSSIPLVLFGGNPVGYNIRLKGQHEDNFTDFYVTFEVRWINLVDLEPYHSYIIDVCAVNNIGRGPCSRTMVTTDIATPSLAPEIITSDKCLNGAHISLDWSDIPEKNLYGELKEFKLCYTKVKTGETDVTETEICINLGSNVHTINLNAEYASMYKIQIAAANQNGLGVFSKPLFARTCRCPENVYANFNIMKPYIYRDSENNLDGAFPAILESVIKGACGLCCVNGKVVETSLDWMTNGKKESSEKNSATEVALDIDQVTSVSFPILADNYIDDMFGGKFVPCFKHPGSLFIVRRDTYTQQLFGMIEKLFSVWPLLLIFTCMLIPSGMLLWFLDGRKNLPRCFQGSCNGVWLAFVTSATLGYGDYTASTVAGRMMIIFWSFSSLVCTSLIVGAISTFLMSSNVAIVKTSLNGLKISVLGASYEQKLGLKKNAIIPKVYSTVEDVSRAVENSDVDGLLMDSSTASSYSSLFNKSNMVYSQIIKNTMYYGMVISGPLNNANDFFHNYVTENQKDILSLVAKYAKIFEGKAVDIKAFSMFQSDSPTLIDSIWIGCTILGVLILLGTITNFTLCKVLHKPGVFGAYTSKVKDHEALLALLNDFKEHFTEDMDVLDKKHAFERILFPMQGNEKWQNSISLRYKRAILQSTYHKTFYGRDIRLKDAKLLFLNPKSTFI